MKQTIIQAVINGVAPFLSGEQITQLEVVLIQELSEYEVVKSISMEEQQAKANAELLQAYLSA